MAEQTKPLPLIYLVDDDDTQELLIEFSLEKIGFESEFRYFQSPSAALAEIDKTMPAVILLDINMPEMSGWDFLQKLQEKFGERSAPVYMLSSSVFERDQSHSRSFSMVKGFVIKPIDSGQLANILKSF